jgi:hypothetical protein
MSYKQETPNMLNIFTWEEFKLWLNEKFMPHHLVFKDGMELLDFTQGNGVGSFAHYVLDFSQRLNVVPLKK